MDLFGRGFGFGGCFLRFLALGAEPEYSMAVMNRFESIAAHYFILELFDLFAIELD